MSKAFEVARQSWLGKVLFLGVLLLAVSAFADDRITVIHEFSGGAGAVNPTFTLTPDGAGNYYATTFYGGNTHACSGAGCGAAYKLSPAGGGSWRYTELYQFRGGNDGTSPGPLTFDHAGNLYGVMSSGGSSANGVVFKLSPNASGPWTYSVVYTFAGGSDGSFPIGPLAFDSAGNLYGTTANGGGVTCSNTCGTVFKLAPNGGGWSESIINSFSASTSSQGYHPEGGVIIDSLGNLYGTTSAGGNLSAAGCAGTGRGVVFQLTPGTSGWTENVIHTFVFTDGSGPGAPLTMDAKGNLYGTTPYGGTTNSNCGNGCGGVFELSPAAGGTWSLSTPHMYTGNPDGSSSFQPVAVDGAGNVYAASNGGPYNWGVAIELSPNGSGGWTYSRLHNFKGLKDGGNPNGMILDSGGNLFGVTNYGGTAGCINNSGCGAVFELSPAAR
jgi:uncharacterized repeat protein (TIGR03803 family)